MTIRVGETGKKIYIITSFDMTSNTSLNIYATPPSGVSNTKTWTAQLEIGSLSNIVLEDGTAVTSVAANQSMFYELADSTDLSEDGDWTLVGEYINTGASPDDRFLSDPVILTVSKDNITELE